MKKCIISLDWKVKAKEQWLPRSWSMLDFKADCLIYNLKVSKLQDPSYQDKELARIREVNKEKEKR